MKSMLDQRFWTAVATLIAILSGDGSTLFAQPLEIYSRTDAPGGWLGSPATDGGWTGHGKGSTGALSVPANGSLYFAFENTYVEDNKKILGVEFKTTPPGAARLDLNVGMINGYRDQGTSNPASVSASSHASEYAGKIGVNATITPQPEWEMIEIVNSAAMPKTIEVEVAASNCGKRQRTTGGNGVPDSEMGFADHMFGSEGNLPNTTRITAVEVYPRNVDIDQSVAPMFEAPPHTGNWTPEFVFADPNGDPRLRGGVRWTSDGLGLVAGEMHNLAITMIKAADSSYDFFTFDEDFGQYFKIFVDLPTVPWYEDWETHYPDVGCGGWRGWKGWDDDPAFDAPATNGQAHDGDNSLQIGGDADLIRPFNGVDEGRWSFTAWQYIPSDFVSGGSGEASGSFFLLLNTYNDGGPYHWSTALQANSNDGMIKVFHGLGTDTINVPYDTDRWVKIQILTDLEDDWTQVYYDDELVTEYPWTGGVFGDGGGALEIKCVDLFANGSTPVYYDDLSIEKLVPLDDIIVTPDDWNAFRGSHASGDISDVQESDDSYLKFNPGLTLSSTEPPVWIEFDGTLPADRPTSLTVKLEATANTVGITQSIEMFNWDTGQYEEVDSQAASLNNDSVVTVDLTANIVNYVEVGTGLVKTRTGWRATGIVFLYPWTISIDQVAWTVTQ